MPVVSCLPSQGALPRPWADESNPFRVAWRFFCRLTHGTVLFTPKGSHSSAWGSIFLMHGARSLHPEGVTLISPGSRQRTLGNGNARDSLTPKGLHNETPSRPQYHPRTD